MNGELTPWDVGADPRDRARAAIRHRRVRGHALVRHRRRPGDLPARRAHAPLRAVGELLRARPRLLVRRPLRGVARRRSRERAGERVSPPDRVLRLVQLQRVAEGLPGHGRDHRGPRAAVHPGRTGARRARDGVDRAPHRFADAAAVRESVRPLHQLGARGAGSVSSRLRRGDSAELEGRRRRRLRREPVLREERHAVSRTTSTRRSSSASRATACSRSPATSGCRS